MSEPKKNIRKAWRTEKMAVRDRIIRQPITIFDAWKISYIIITNNTPIIFPRLKKSPKSFLNYFGAISLR